MRILALTARFPYPPNRGDRLRAYNFIRSLSQEHEIHLISFIEQEAERAYIAEMEKYCAQVRVIRQNKIQSAMAIGLRILWQRDPLQVLYYRSRAMQALVDEMIRENTYDIAYVHLFRMAQFVEHIPNLYRIIDLTDVISEEVRRSMPYRQAASRTMFRLEGPRVVRYERWAANHFEESWLISGHDASVLRQACPGSNIHVVRNGVDTKRFRPQPIATVPNRLLFVGHMSVFHNVDAATYLAQKILPLVRQQIPEVTLRIVGAEPNTAAQALDALPNVDVVGFVDDLNAELNATQVFVAPLRFAAGVQNKVLEAMAAGRPVVTTPLVNQGIGAADGTHLLTGQTPDELAARILTLLRTPEQRAKIGAAGMLFVRGQYNWDLVRKRVGEIEYL